MDNNKFFKKIGCDMPGFVSGLANDDYHGGPGVSRSFLFRLLTYTPAHAIVPIEPTPAMAFGSAFHIAILEYDKFYNDYASIPIDCLPGSGRGQKARLEEWMSENSDKRIIKPDDLDRIMIMKKSIFDHPDAAELLSDGEPEVSGYWADPVYPDIICKIRMDWINKSKRAIVDVKTTSDARDFAFTRDAYKYGYHMEAAAYLYGATQITGVEHHDFYFVIVETSPPYGVRVLKADPEFVQEGLIDYNKALAIYKQCEDENHYPCYPVGIDELFLPAWKMKKDGVIFDK